MSEVSVCQNVRGVRQLTRFALILDPSPADHEEESSRKLHNTERGTQQETWLENTRVEYARRSQEGTLATVPSELGRFAQPTAASLGQQDDSRTEQEQTMCAQRHGRDLIAVDSNAHAERYASRQGAGQLATSPEALGHLALPTQAWQASLSVDRLNALTPREQATYAQQQGRTSAHAEGSAQRDAWEWRQKNGVLSMDVSAAQLGAFAKDTASSLVRASSMNRKDFSTQAELTAYEEQRIRNSLATASANERTAWQTRQTNNELATVPDDLGRFSTDTINWRSYTSSADSIIKTQKELEWDGGNRRNLHQSLTQAKEDYHARPANRRGVPLPTTPIDVTLATETRAQERAASKSQLSPFSALDEIEAADWKRAQEVRALWEKRMRHVLRGQQPRNEFYFHKRPSDIPEGPEDVADGSAIAVAEKKKTFKKHHGWKMPLSTLRQTRPYESTAAAHLSSPPSSPSSSSSSFSSWWKRSGFSVPRTIRSSSSSTSSSSAAAAAQPSSPDSTTPLDPSMNPNSKSQGQSRSTNSRFFRSAPRPSPDPRTIPATNKEMAPSSCGTKYQPANARGHSSSSHVSFQGEDCHVQGRTNFQLRMKASKENEHLQSKTIEANTPVGGQTLQSSPILRPSPSPASYTPPRKAAGAGASVEILKLSPPPSPGPSTFRGVSAARKFQAAIRKDVLFLEQRHGSSSNCMNVMGTRTRSTSNASSISSNSSSSSSTRSDVRDVLRHDGRPVGKDGKFIAPGVRLAARSRPATPIAFTNQDSPVVKGTTI